MIARNALHAAFVAAAGTCALLTAPATATPPVKIMPLGDSITVGSDGGYRLFLYHLLNDAGHTIDFVGSVSVFGTNWPHLPDPDHEGHGGWRINNIQRNIENWMTTYEPDVILLHIGTNDISNNETARQVTYQLWDLIGDIYAIDPDVELHVASIILRTGNQQQVRVTEQYAAATPYVVEHFAKQGFDCRYVDMHSALTAADLEDNLHPNMRGHAKMGLKWFESLDLPVADLHLSMTPPFPGEEATLTTTLAPAGAEVHYYASIQGFGSTYINELGVTLDMQSPIVLGSAAADESGTSVLVGTVAEEAAAMKVYVQAACEGLTSQVLVRNVRTLQ